MRIAVRLLMVSALVLIPGISVAGTHYGTVWGSGISEKVVWRVVQQYARTAARDSLPTTFGDPMQGFATQPGVKMEQIQFPPGHVSVQRRNAALGCK